MSSAEARLTVAQSKIAAAVAQRDAAGAQTDVARKQLEELQTLIDYRHAQGPVCGDCHGPQCRSRRSGPQHADGFRRESRAAL